MSYCLLPHLAENFKKALATGKIDPAKLGEMTSEERHAFFAKIVGEADAKGVNTLFESKLILKNKETGMINWAKQLTGIKPEVRRDMIKRIQTMVDKGILDPKSEEAFLHDLASKRLGTDVTFDEAKQITDLASKVSKLKEADMTIESNRIAYGNAILDMHDYVESLKPGMRKFEQVANVANVPRAIMSTLDFSAPFRQGFGMVSRANFWKNLAPMFKSAFSESAYRDLQAEIITRPSYPSMQKAGLRIMNLSDKLTQREEAYMTTLLDKVPGIRGSERAYTAFLSKLRADSFDDLLKKAELAGEDVKAGSQVNKELANVVNNFTGSGKLGNVDQASPIANALFFSPRKIAATVQKMNPKNYLDPRISATARKEAFRNLIGQVGVSASIIGLAHAAGASVEIDPRSSDFGKIKIGNVHIDVTGGDATYAVLLARLVTGQTKSTTSDIVRDLGEGFKSQTRGDVAASFMRNKLSPVASVVADWLTGKDANQQAFSLTNEAKNLVTPMIINTALSAFKDDPSHALLAVAADMFGFGANTYTNNVDWNQSDGKEIGQFKETVGQNKFDQANADYNASLAGKIEKLKNSAAYQALPEDDKSAALTKLKTTQRASTFAKYGFHYKQDRDPQKAKSLDMMVRSIGR